MALSVVNIQSKNSNIHSRNSPDDNDNIDYRVAHNDNFYNHPQTSMCLYDISGAHMGILL